ncbi:MAG: LysR family transcriptional regulator [Cypionkella sp.]|nr:LysR family transcriptional regulator [Cypionkella sp.]
MDLALIRTFIEVSETGSFVAASERLFVTQSAVSLRVQRLEELLGHPLFLRSKSGVEITPSGREFVTYAKSLLRTWEQARQQLALPVGFTKSLTIGAQSSLWPGLGFRLIDKLRAEMPDLGLRVELGLPNTFTRAMTEGVMQMALTYQPTFSPGLSIEKVIEDELVLVAPWENPKIDDLHGRYAFIDWGTDYLHFHNIHLPALTNPGLTMSMGSLSARYVIGRQLAAYLPARVAKYYLDREELFLVEGAATFTHTAWSVWRDDLDEELATVAHKALFEVAELAASETVDVVDQV